ncbi:hypothetical protein ACYAFX_28940 (plasmid) [Rhodococcus aetherivorans]
MDKVQHEVEQAPANRGSGVSYVSEDRAQKLLDKHMSRWAPLLDRLK